MWRNIPWVEPLQPSHCCKNCSKTAAETCRLNTLASHLKSMAPTASALENPSNARDFFTVGTFTMFTPHEVFNVFQNGGIRGHIGKQGWWINGCKWFKVCMYVCMYHGSSRFKYYIPWCSAAAEQKNRCLKNETHDTWIVECVLSVHPWSHERTDKI